MPVPGLDNEFGEEISQISNLNLRESLTLEKSSKVTKSQLCPPCPQSSECHPQVTPPGMGIQPSLGTSNPWSPSPWGNSCCAHPEPALPSLRPFPLLLSLFLEQIPNPPGVPSWQGLVQSHKGP